MAEVAGSTGFILPFHSLVLLQGGSCPTRNHICQFLLLPPYLAPQSLPWDLPTLSLSLWLDVNDQGRNEDEGPSVD